MSGVKQCKGCGASKSLQEFAKNHKSKDGSLNTCKSCVATKRQANVKGISLRKAINDKCKECIATWWRSFAAIYDPYVQGLGSWRQQEADESCEASVERIKALRLSDFDRFEEEEAQGVAKLDLVVKKNKDKAFNIQNALDGKYLGDK